MDFGNPGKAYEWTRHNAGFIAIDEISKKMGIEVTKEKFDALIGMGEHHGEKIMLVKPQTYMNLSGESVLQILNFYKLLPEDLIVIYDDVDLDFGNIRIRPYGSPGTHNGMRNITNLIGTQEFIRIRMGMGKPLIPGMDLKDYVLMNFSSEEKETIESLANIVYNALVEILDHGVKSAMNLYNSNKK
ncbi:MAG: aminoacyl-tRNA hydrolase [Clostridia bacterium]|nr:aminoacyl-tRNA hydrolase [Clostridia bacterium]